MTTRRYGSSPSERVPIPSTSLSASWTILRSADDIGSSTRATPDCLHLVGHLQREPIERLLAALAIATDVDTQAGVVIAEAPLRGDPGEILHGLQRRATRSDQQAEILAVHVHLEIVAVLDQFGCTR